MVHVLLKRIGFVVLGLALLYGAHAVAIDGVGESDVEYRADGPQGPGLYEVRTTYPVAGLVMGIGGLGFAARGLLGDVEDEAGGGPADGDSRFGTGDGASDETSPADAADDAGCPSCGESLEPSATFCTGCGTELGVSVDG